MEAEALKEPRPCERCNEEFTNRWWETSHAALCPDCRLDDELKWLKEKGKE